MGAFVARRFAHAVAAIVLTTFVVFLGTVRLGDPFLTRGEKMLPPETVAALHAKFGMDKPFLVRYLIYLKNLFSGELGVDFENRRPVADLLAHTAPNTLRLAVFAMALVVLMGIAAGTIAAVLRSPFVDTFFSVTTVLMICVPSFALASLLRVHVSGLRLFGFEIFPAVPHPFMAEVPWYKEILLPAATLAIHEAAFISRIMRTSMLEVLDSDFVRTARAKGLSRFTVIRKHVLRNALIPVTNYGGIAIGVLMGGSLIIETIFNYDGIGHMFVGALHTNNSPIIVAVAVYSLITFIVASAAVDVLSAYLDPRIRLN